jgi:hypothetical protein
MDKARAGGLMKPIAVGFYVRQSELLIVVHATNLARCRCSGIHFSFYLPVCVTGPVQPGSAKIPKFPVSIRIMPES